MSDEKPYPVHPPVARAERALNGIVDSVIQGKDPLRRAQAAGDILNMLQASANELREVRAEAVTELNAGGMGYGAIAAALGVSKSRMQQLLGRAPKAHRMGKIEAFTRTEAARLREAGTPDSKILRTLLPQIIEVPSAERFTASEVADMLGMRVSDVRTEWNRAVKEKRANRGT